MFITFGGMQTDNLVGVSYSPMGPYEIPASTPTYNNIPNLSVGAGSSLMVIAGFANSLTTLGQFGRGTSTSNVEASPGKNSNTNFPRFMITTGYFS